MSENFAELFEASLKNKRDGFNPGEKVEATIIKIGKHSVFIDVNASSEGFIDADELRDKAGAVKYQEGDKIVAYFVSAKNGFEFTVKMSADSAVSHLQEIFEAKIPVEGKVLVERNGGFTVMIGNVEAFCPYSQIDLFRGEAATYLGEKYSFIITEYNNRNLVVSRRKLLEHEAAERLKNLQYNLAEGDLVEGKIVRIMNFGAFLDLGAGTTGLIPISELAWGHVDDVNQIVCVNQEVKVKVIRLDWVNEKITLSLRQAANNPWTDITSRYEIGSEYSGVITRLTNFGAFVELERGVEGLVHISKLGAGRRINHPKEVVQEGQVVEFAIESIDTDNQRISLTMEQSFGHDVEESTNNDLVIEGQKVVGIVTDVKEFGVFVKLTNSQTGLLHVSETEAAEAQSRSRSLAKLYPIGSEVEVIVDQIDGNRLSLTLPNNQQENQQELEIALKSNSNENSSFGSLDSMFDNLKL
ncbi:MAG: S1 RNA-binding domain-containing protein [Lentisphaeria bacterium]